MEHGLRSIAAPSLLVGAAVASFALAGRAPLSLNFYLAWVRDLCLLAAGALWLALGIRLVRRDGMHLRTLSFSIAGLAVLGFVGISSLHALRTYQSVIESLRPEPDLKRIEQITSAVISNPESNAEKRKQASEFRARVTFHQTGEILPVLDLSGAESPFVPTEADRDMWRANRDLRVLLPYGAASIRSFLQVFGLVVLSSVAVGVGTRIRRAPAV